MSNLEYEENVSKRYWESTIEKTDEATFFQTPAWADIIHEAYHYLPATRVYDVDGTPVLIPMMKTESFGLRAYHSMPYGYGGVFPASDLSPAAITRACKQITGGFDILFNIVFPPRVDGVISENGSFQRISSIWDQTHLLFLDKPFEKIISQFNRNTRRNIKNAKKNGIQTKQVREGADIRKLYALYERRCLEWGYAAPPCPWEFFECLSAHAAPHATFHCAEMGGEIVAGLIFIEYHNRGFIYSNFSPKDVAQYGPVCVLFNDIISTAHDRGMEYINLGSSGNLSGVRRFKEGFGAEEFPLKRYQSRSFLGKVKSRVERSGFTLRSSH